MPKKSCLCFCFYASLIPPTSIAKGLGLVRHWCLIKQDFQSVVGSLTVTHTGEAWVEEQLHGKDFLILSVI